MLRSIFILTLIYEGRVYTIGEKGSRTRGPPATEVTTINPSQYTPVSSRVDRKKEFRTLGARSATPRSERVRLSTRYNPGASLHKRIFTATVGHLGGPRNGTGAAPDIRPRKRTKLCHRRTFRCLY